MPRFKNVPVHVSSPVRIARKMSQAQRSTQAGKRRGSALESRGSKRARVLRHEPAANLPAGVAEEELMEEELTPPPEDTSGSESESDSGSGSDSSGEKTESEQTRRRDGGGEGQSGRRQEQPAESFEEEAEFVRVSTSETQSPEVQESAEGSRRTEEPRTAALSPRTVRRQRSAKHAHAAALRKAPATKNNQKGAMRAFQVSNFLNMLVYFFC